jgi:hypothetical protein
MEREVFESQIECGGGGFMWTRAPIVATLTTTPQSPTARRGPACAAITHGRARLCHVLLVNKVKVLSFQLRASAPPYFKDIKFLQPIFGSICKKDSKLQKKFKISILLKDCSISLKNSVEFPEFVMGWCASSQLNG